MIDDHDIELRREPNEVISSVLGTIFLFGCWAAGFWIVYRLLVHFWNWI